MGDSRDEDRVDRRSGPTGPLSQRITVVCCQELLFSAVELLGKFDLARVAAACADALGAILTFWRIDNTSSHPKDMAPSTSQDREMHRVHEEKNMSALIYSSREPLAHMKNTIHEKGVVKISVTVLIPATHRNSLVRR